MTARVPNNNDEALGHDEQHTSVGLNDAAVAEGSELDSGPSRGGARKRENSTRRCIGTGEVGSPAQMIRFVLSPDGHVTPDLAAKLPGRGAWVLCNGTALEQAIARNAFSRAFKTQVSVPDGLVETVRDLIFKKALDGLGLARRAGEVISGFDMVRDAVKTTEIACLLEASDGAEDGRNKLIMILRARDFASREPQIEENVVKSTQVALVGCFTSEELGMALGRERVIHACIKDGLFGRAWVDEIVRFSGFQRVWPEDWLSLEAL